MSKYLMPKTSLILSSDKTYVWSAKSIDIAIVTIVNAFGYNFLIVLDVSHFLGETYIITQVTYLTYA